MLQQAISPFFLILSFMTLVLSLSTTNSTVYVQCSQLNFTSMTPYESNVNSLFTSILDSAPIYNFNKFETSPQSDGVYGLFQCRGDLSSPNCKDCVANAVSQLKTTCPISTGGEIQLEECLVKYDNSSFFGVQGKVEAWRRCGPSLGYNWAVMNRINGALGYLVSGSGQYFRGGAFGSIQGAAQCVQDISLSDCQDCLLEACGRLRTECETSTWGDMYMGKCYIRYADQGNESLVDKGKSSSKSNGGWSKNKIIKWTVIVIGVAVGLGSLTLVVKGCCTINVNNKVIKNLRRDLETTRKEAESAKSEAESAKEMAEKAERKVEEESMKSGYSCNYYPYGTPMSGPMFWV